MYPGYEIEKFEDEGGKCYLILTSESSLNTVEADNGVEIQEQQQKEDNRQL